MVTGTATTQKIQKKGETEMCLWLVSLLPSVGLEEEEFEKEKN